VIVFLSGLAVCIVIGLASYAFVLTRKVKQQQAELSEKLVEEQRKHAKQRKYIVESLNIIAANVLEEGLNLSEATIRSKMLLDGLLLSPEERKPFAVLDEVFELVQNFATHDARKTLKRSEIISQDSQREEIEQRYEEGLKECYSKLRQFKDPKS
jgi:hypothetical protein